MKYFHIPQQREAPLHLMSRHDTLMPTLFKLLLPTLRYMGDDKNKSSLSCHVRNIHDANIGIKTLRDKYPPLIRDPEKTYFKVGGKVLFKNHTQTNAFDSKYKASFRACKRISDKGFDVQDITGKIR